MQLTKLGQAVKLGRMSTQEQTLWTLGWRLRWAIEHADLDIQQLAAELEVSRTTISRWIHDEEYVPKKLFLKATADLCNVDFNWLETGEGWPTGAVPTPAPRPPRGPRGPKRITRRPTIRTHALLIDLSEPAAA